MIYQLADNLSMQKHIKDLQNTLNQGIDLNKILQEQKQEMKLLELVREFERATEELKQMKTSFEQEKKQYFNKLEEYTRVAVEKAISKGLEKAFSK